MASPEGKSLVARFEFPIERGKIREFARATGSSHNAYMVEDPPTIPATFLISSVLCRDEDVSPWSTGEFDISTMLNGEHEFVFVGPCLGRGRPCKGRSDWTASTTR
jgi:hypothetical protein